MGSSRVIVYRALVATANENFLSYALEALRWGFHRKACCEQWSLRPSLYCLLAQ